MVYNFENKESYKGISLKFKFQTQKIVDLHDICKKLDVLNISG